jgi:dTDP-4-dehydrorhamnose reductase
VRVLVTGGDGRLGRELQSELPRLGGGGGGGGGGGVEAFYPTKTEVDITHPGTILAALERYQPDIVLHAAAFTDVKGAESQKELCWRVNVEGTRNVVRALLAASPAKLVHISTDYVFWGDRGGYAEEDPVGPVRNYYALSKLASEEVARVHPNALVIRTSFRPREWPYPVAFTDVYTGQDYVDIIAPEVALAAYNAQKIPHDIVHIVTERKSVYELARRRSPGVRPSTRREAGVDLPEDVSLDARRWQAFKDSLGSAAFR